jgi:hypothetical protein
MKPRKHPATAPCTPEARAGQSSHSTKDGVAMDTYELFVNRIHSTFFVKVFAMMNFVSEKYSLQTEPHF